MLDKDFSLIDQLAPWLTRLARCHELTVVQRRVELVVVSVYFSLDAIAILIKALPCLGEQSLEPRGAGCAFEHLDIGQQWSSPVGEDLLKVVVGFRQVELHGAAFVIEPDVGRKYDCHRKKVIDAQEHWDTF